LYSEIDMFLISAYNKWQRVKHRPYNNHVTQRFYVLRKYRQTLDTCPPNTSVQIWAITFDERTHG